MQNKVCFLDVSRTISRLHLPTPTGIDRVEQAYIAHFSSNYPSSFAVARLGQEYLFTDLKAFSALTFRDQDKLGFLGRDGFRFRLSPGQRRTKAVIRKRFDWISERAFCTKITEHAGDGAVYLNVGHSRALLPLWQRFRDVPLMLIAMVHDVIPLSHPHFVRPRSIDNFKKFLEGLRNFTRVICVSKTTQEALSSEGTFPNMSVAPLGISFSNQRAASASASRESFFLAVGTLEPRKNYSLLFDILENGDMPGPLVIVGQRGWESDAFFKRLEGLVARGLVDWRTDATDDELQTLYERCAAVLFPSFVEGFGLPAYEAVATEAPLIASDIPVFREAFGRSVPLLDPTNVSTWSAALKTTERFRSRVSVPTWDNHFQEAGF